MPVNIIFNALGIQDSGGISVLDKALSEINGSPTYMVQLFLYENTNTSMLHNDFSNSPNITFRFIDNHGIRTIISNKYR